MIILWHFTWFHYTSRLTLLPSDLLVARCGGSGAPPSFCLYFKFHNIIVELIKHTFTWAQVLITFAPRDLDSWARLFLDFVLLRASWSFLKPLWTSVSYCGFLQASVSLLPPCCLSLQSSWCKGSPEIYHTDVHKSNKFSIWHTKSLKLWFIFKA